MSYKCQKHKQKSYYVDIRKNAQQRIVCQKCIQENKILIEDLKDINDI